MEQKELTALLARVADGRISPDEAAHALKVAPVTELGYATIDNHRGIRQGVSEVIYGEGKTPEQIAGICAAMREAGQKRILITRLDEEKALAVEAALVTADATQVRSEVPQKSSATSLAASIEALENAAASFTYYDTARIGIVGSMPEPDGNGTIVIACAGTSDLPVAEEAAITAEMLGNNVKRLYDVGVAGIHRLLAHADDIADASVIVAVAGMEGALASVVGGMASCPVIAVPTSIGYGASFGGVAALLAMLNSCASGISVVNIDNGFGAGYQAHMINHVKVSNS